MLRAGKRTSKRLRAQVMRRWGTVAEVILLAILLAAGCGRTDVGGFGGNIPPPAGSSTVSLVITDSPPAGVTVLSFEATITGATLNPGSVSLLSSPVQVELKHLETEMALLGTATVPSGTYNSTTLTLANAEVTFKNDTAGTLAGCSNVPPNNVCETKPNTSGTVTIAFSAAQTIQPNTTIGFLIDVNLSNILTAALGVDFSAAGGFTAQPVTITGGLAQLDDVLGRVATVTPVNQQFTLETSQGTLTVNADSNTVFDDFLAGGCSSANIACVLVNQIVEADLLLRSDGTLLATRVKFEDRDVSESELDGTIAAVDTLNNRFTFVLLEAVPGVPGLEVGDVLTVTLTATTFEVDSDGLPVPAGLSFASAADLLVGQRVQVRRDSVSSGSTVQADRVRLKKAQFTAKVDTKLNATDFTVNVLPALFTSAGISAVEARTSTQTGFEPSGTSVATLVAGDTVSLGGLLFRRVVGNPVLVAGKVRKR